MKTKKAYTKSKIVSTGIFDNGQFPEAYNKYQKTEVYLSSHYDKVYVNFCEITEGVRGRMGQIVLNNLKEIQTIKNEEIKSAALSLI